MSKSVMRLTSFVILIFAQSILAEHAQAGLLGRCKNILTKLRESISSSDGSNAERKSGKLADPKPAAKSGPNTQAHDWVSEVTGVPRVDVTQGGSIEPGKVLIKFAGGANAPRDAAIAINQENTFVRVTGKRSVIVEPGRATEDAATVFKSKDGQTLYAVVADGMGGHGSGNLAASAVVDTFAKEIGESGSSLIDAAQASAKKMQSILENNPGANKNMGSCVGAFEINLKTGAVTLTGVGDSGAMLIRADGTFEVTRDQTYVAMLLEGNQIKSEGEALNHPKSEVVTNFIDAKGIKYAEDISQVPGTAKDGDWLVAYSDGIRGMLTPQEIAEIVLPAKTPQEVSDRLMAAIYKIKKTGRTPSGRQQTYYPDDVSVVATRVKLH